MSLKALFFALAGCALLISGCGGPQHPVTYPVTGKVLLKGQPVAGASVVFVPQSGSERGATATSDADGSYKLTTYEHGDGARPGEYKIKVSKYEMKNEPAGTTDALLTLEAEEEGYDPSATEKIVDPKNELPGKYEDETRSGLVHTVVNQPTTFEISLD